MLRTEKEKYLGNILTSKAKINENIIYLGVGLINEIMQYHSVIIILKSGYYSETQSSLMEYSAVLKHYMD